MKQFNLHVAKIFIFLIPLSIFSTFFFAQSIKIEGKIIDDITKAPLEGVNVTIKNSNTGTSTKADGNFSLMAPAKSRLLVTFIGYQLKEVDASENIVIQLSPAATQLTDVVVTALGVKKETKKIGYAIQEVKGEDLIKARDQNPITGLAGKVAGLSVGPSAELLRSPTVLLRGNAINLYVVDGVPISSDTWNISPDDIESYTVLKGPAAAALYGSTCF